MNANEIRDVKNVRNYAKNYHAAKAAKLELQAQRWLRHYERACKLIGCDPLI